ncbi:cbb3-type cytochrome c oxidase subunit II [Arhodomonas sp. SL1]|uniref:cbb3-type cytochrome c oxidase subunit II n=1 Tax=Arhodomonas sp. SL1 TaxID=3425691 RepID=UPI003F8847F1
MRNTLAIMAGAALILMLSMLFLVLMPYLQIQGAEPADELQPYTEAEQRGRAVYIAEGCIYCHSQQPRDGAFSAADRERGWGRPSVPADYAYDQPHLLGTMRTGPDLLNVGARLPSDDWHLVHLYNPRAVVADSIMPPYRYLFETVDTPVDGERVVSLPEGLGPSGGREVVATRRALDLVAYLQALDRTYPTAALPTREPAEGDHE